MNLLANRLSIKRLLKPGLILLIPVFFGCETQSDLGIQYDLGSQANVRFIEFDLPASNIYIDSLRTDGENNVLIGNYSNSLTGSVQAEAYFNLLYLQGPFPRGFTIDEEENPDTLQIDSAYLTLETNDLISSLVQPNIDFSVYELEDSLREDAVYLSSFQQTLGDEIASISQSINPAIDTIFRLRLSDTYAQSVYSKISEIAGDAGESISVNSFKSLGIVPNGSFDALASIQLLSDTSELTLYTSPVDPESKDTTYQMTFRLTSDNYSYLERDRSGSSFSGINEFENFDISSGETVIDPIAGITTVLSLSTVESFLSENPSVIINSATLAFDFQSENERDTLITFISLFRKSNDRIFGPALESNSFDNIMMTDNAYLSLNAIPSSGVLSTEKNEILVFGTLFFQQLLGQVRESGELNYISPSGRTIPITDFVLISPIDVTLQRTIIKENGIKLRLYYTEVD